jgi:hypothetical protein
MSKNTIHIPEELEARNSVLFQKLVPLQGKCKTQEGETLRAVNKIVYRYYNDGDRFWIGYGTEAGPGAAHAYLVEKSPFRAELEPILDGMVEVTDNKYERGLVELVDTVVTRIELMKRNKKKLTPNEDDMLECEARFEEDACPVRRWS